MTATPNSVTDSEARPQRSRPLVWERSLVAVGGMWAIVGLHLDGWSHRSRRVDEAFFTPWHGVLYSGFLFGVASSLLVIWRFGLVETQSVVFRRGKRQFAGGVTLVMVGAVTDGFWHTFIGIEQNLETLFSPPHLLLMFGALLAATAAVREAWWEPYSPTTMTVATMVNLTVTTMLLTYFLHFASPLNSSGLRAHGMGEEAIAISGSARLTIGGTTSILYTILLFGGLLLVSQRWRLRRGQVAVMTGGPLLGLVGLDGFENEWLLWAILSYVLLAELATELLRPHVSFGVWRIRIWAALLPTIWWSCFLITYEVANGVTWSIEVWTGIITWSAIVGYLLSFLAAGPSAPVDNVDPARRI